MRRELQSLVDAVTPSPDAADLAAEILAHQVIELSGCSPTPSVTRLGWRSTTTGCKESSSRVGQVGDRMKVSTAKTTLVLRCFVAAWVDNPSIASMISDGSAFSAQGGSMVHEQPADRA
jgi:hypothetical protein